MGEKSSFSFVPLFCCSGKNKIQIQTQAVKFVLYNFGNSTLNAYRYAFKTSIIQYKDQQ